ncbi:MAG: hypothetical protein ABIK62_00905, partial [candidate division WOR-3 bacterium]
ETLRVAFSTWSNPAVGCYLVRLVAWSDTRSYFDTLRWHCVVVAEGIEGFASQCLLRLLPEPTVVGRNLWLGIPEQHSTDRPLAYLLDVCGRRVFVLHSGMNDVSSLSPGIYFIRPTLPNGEATRKVAVTE